MSLAFVFWVMMLAWLVFSVWSSWPNVIKGQAVNLFMFALFFIIGWQVFGPPIHR